MLGDFPLVLKKNGLALDPCGKRSSFVVSQLGDASHGHRTLFVTLSKLEVPTNRHTVLAIDNLGEFAGLSDAIFEVIANRAQLADPRPEGPVIEGPAGILQTPFDLDALRRAQVIRPLEVGSNVLPGAAVDGIILNTRLALKNLVEIIQTVGIDSLLQKRLPGERLIVAELPAQARADIHAAASGVLAAGLDDLGELPVETWHIAAIDHIGGSPPLKT